MRINQRIKKPQPEEIGRGFKFIGISETGEYMYSRMIDGKEHLYPIDPLVWDDTKLIFEDAIKRNATSAYSVEALRRKLNN